jgi:hypothetical protein
LAYPLKFLTLSRIEFRGELDVHPFKDAGQIPKVLLPELFPVGLRTSEDWSNFFLLLRSEMQLPFEAPHGSLSERGAVLMVPFSGPIGERTATNRTGHKNSGERENDFPGLVHANVSQKFPQ